MMLRDDTAGLQAVARDYPDGATVGDHCHADGQFIHATAGVMEIRAADRLWLVPPQRALWIPPRMPHGLRARGRVSLRTLYVGPNEAGRFGKEPSGFVVPPLLRELLLRALDPDLDGDSPRKHRLAAVLIDELRALPPDDLWLAMPSDPRLARVCADILARPGSTHRIDHWAQQSGASVRTLRRLARTELGCPLSTWRQQARILSAIPRLIAGEPVILIAQAMGYETPGAFAAMFRRITGVQPHAYRQMR